MRLVSIILVFFFALSLSSQEKREWDIYTDWSDINDAFYEEMSLQEQVEVYCVYFDDPRYYQGAHHPKAGFHGVLRYFKNQKDEEAIPYFLYHFAAKDLPVFSSPDEAYLDFERLTLILRLMEYRGGRLENLDIDVALQFATLAEGKILEYIVRNKRIDANIRILEFYTQSIQNYSKGLHRVDWLPKKDPDDRWRHRYWGKVIYDKYVVGNGLEFLDVGIESPYVFEGYTGRVITPDDPGYLGPLLP